MSSTSERTAGGADRLRLLAVTCFGLGLAPFAPGTFGTLGGVAIAVPLAYVPGLPLWAWLLVATTVVVAIGIPLGNWAERRFAKKDPGFVVLDEVAGYLVTVLVYDAFHGVALSFPGHVAAFALFRVADILKPPPGRQLEKLPGGVGVMLDDVVLALYSGIALSVLGWVGFQWL